MATIPFESQGGAEVPADDRFLGCFAVPADEYGRLAAHAQRGRHDTPVTLDEANGGVLFYPEESAFNHETGRTTFAGTFVTRVTTRERYRY